MDTPNEFVNYIYGKLKNRGYFTDQIDEMIEMLQDHMVDKAEELFLEYNKSEEAPDPPLRPFFQPVPIQPTVVEVIENMERMSNSTPEDRAELQKGMAWSDLDWESRRVDEVPKPRKTIRFRRYPRVPSESPLANKFFQQPAFSCGADGDHGEVPRKMIKEIADQVRKDMENLPIASNPPYPDEPVPEKPKEEEKEGQHRQARWPDYGQPIVEHPGRFSDKSPSFLKQMHVIPPNEVDTKSWQELRRADEEGPIIEWQGGP